MDADSRKQVKGGAVLSYVLIAINTVSSLLLTPFLISRIGEDDYGVYKTITSLAASLTVIDFGLGDTVQRFVAKYITEKKKDKIDSFFSNSIFASLLLGLLLIIISVILFFSLGSIYGDTFSKDQMSDARLIFVFSGITILVHVFESVFNGIITGYNRFVFSNATKVIAILIRIFLYVVYVELRADAVGLAVIALFLDLFVIIVEMIYSIKVVGVRVVRIGNDSFREYISISGGYTILMFISAVISQICLNMDNVIIGAIKGPEFVTVYSIGIMIYLMFSNLSTSISGVMLPTVTSTLSKKDGEKKVIDIVVAAGRMQFMLLGAATVGFVLIGKEFIRLWLGDGYEDVYIITLILIIPALFELCINTCLSILRAKNKMMFRTVSLGASAMINAVLSIVLVKYWSYIGAAIGTAVSYVLCSLIAMNLYYQFKMKMNMLHIYGRILKGIWLCLITAGIAMYAMDFLLEESWRGFIFKVIVFLIVYLLSLFLFGFSVEDKEMLFKRRKNK